MWWSDSDGLMCKTHSKQIGTTSITLIDHTEHDLCLISIYDTEDDNETRILGTLHYSSHRVSTFTVFVGGDLALMRSFDLAQKDSYDDALQDFIYALSFNAERRLKVELGVEDLMELWKMMD